MARLAISLSATRKQRGKLRRQPRSFGQCFALAEFLVTFRTLNLFVGFVQGETRRSVQARCHRDFWANKRFMLRAVTQRASILRCNLRQFRRQRHKRFTVWGFMTVNAGTFNDLRRGLVLWAFVRSEQNRDRELGVLFMARQAPALRVAAGQRESVVVLELGHLIERMDLTMARRTAVAVFALVRIVVTARAGDVEPQIT